MIALIILLIVLNSSADAQTLDDLVRNGYAAYSIGQFEEAKEILDKLNKEYPDSHNGQLLKIMVEVKKGNDIKAGRLLAEFDNSCDMDSSSCDSPSAHIIAKLARCRMQDSESEYRKVDEMITEITNGLYKSCYESQIDLFIRNDDPAKACEACDGYIRMSEDDVNQGIALKCFVVYYSYFKNEAARWLWGQLNYDNRKLLRRQFGKIEF